MDIQQIRDLKAYYVDKYYNTLRAEQAEDVEFYNDTFDVPQLSTLSVRSRTGEGARKVDEPTEILSTGKLTVTRPQRKETAKEEDKATGVSGYFNEIFVPSLVRRNPNPVHTFLKNQFLYGEAWIHPVHNETWVVRPITKDGLPVLLVLSNPLNIFASPNESDDGIPEHVIVVYERLPWVVKSLYPAWTDPKAAERRKKQAGKEETSLWLEYWDKDKRYFEADGEPVLKDEIQDNIYGFVPFVHKISGYGTDAPDGKPEDRVVGRIRKYRDQLKRDCAIVSDMDSIMHNFADRSIDVQPVDDNHSVPKDFRDKYQMGTGLIHEIPYGFTVTRAVQELLEPQYFQYYYNLKQDIRGTLPAVLSGEPVGQSGRLQDISLTTAMKLFEQQIKNTQYAFETAFSMVLKMFDRVPKLRPDELAESDIDKYYTVEVSLKGDDPLENERLSSRGSRMFQSGEIDLEENLTKYQGKTPEQARQIKINILKERILFSPNSPLAQIIAMRAAEKAGMGDELKALMAQAQALETGGKTATATEMARGQGEIKTEMGREMVDSSMVGVGARNPPAPFTRQ